MGRNLDGAVFVDSCGDRCQLVNATRFTDEIFAALISIIFIVSAIAKLVEVFQDPESFHDQALLSLLLALGTFYLAMSDFAAAATCSPK